MRALDLVKPYTRQRLYWTARGVFVTDRTQLPAFDGVFAEVFGVDEHEDPELSSAAAEGRSPDTKGSGAGKESDLEVPRSSPATSSGWRPRASTRSSRTSSRSCTG